MADCKIEMIDGNINITNGILKKNQFNHLKIHSQYSICEGAVKIDDLKDFVKK